MKTELVNIPNKGLCILISDIDIEKFNNAAGYEGPGYGQQYVNNNIFSDINIIADEIRSKRKIGAIKEVRAQTNWGLREAKDYIDKYIPMGHTINDSEFYNIAAFKFFKDHTIQDFILTEEMIIK